MCKKRSFFFILVDVRVSRHQIVCKKRRQRKLSLHSTGFHIKGQICVEKEKEHVAIHHYFFVSTVYMVTTHNWISGIKFFCFFLLTYHGSFLIQVTTEAMIEHMNNLLKIRGSKVLFGGEPLANHSIPKIYGAMKPTAVFVPLEEILKSGNFELVTKEIFGPFQVIDPRCNYVTIMKIIQ